MQAIARPHRNWPFAAFGAGRRYVAARLEQIASDPALRWFGACLAATNLVTVAFWVTDQRIDAILTSEPAICWPLWPECYRWRGFELATVEISLAALAVAAIVGAMLFIRARSVFPAWLILLAATSLKTWLVAQDYRLILNQHYMALLVTVVFLFWPSPRLSIRYLLVAFYVSAGLLKWNTEWLSGAALYGRHPLGLPAAAIPAACGYVVILELVIVHGINSRREWLFAAALGQLILFHISSFWVVGFFYPVLMFLLLAIVPLSRYLTVGTGTKGSDGGPGVRRFASDPERRAAYLLLFFFACLQMIPRLIPGDAAITGEGRMFALNMFDAPLECQATVVRHRGLVAEPDRLRVRFLQPRIACDPVVYWQAALAECRQGRVSGTLDDLDLELATRRKGSDRYQPVVTVHSLCTSQPSYRLLSHNEWIRTGR